jgi:hypothetical protein
MNCSYWWNESEFGQRMGSGWQRMVADGDLMKVGRLGWGCLLLLCSDLLLSHLLLWMVGFAVASGCVSGGPDACPMDALGRTGYGEN